MYYSYTRPSIYFLYFQGNDDAQGSTMRCDEKFWDMNIFTGLRPHAR